jgi:hypothetical protein
MNNFRLYPRYVKTSQVKDCIPLESILNNPLETLTGLTKNKRKVLNYLLFIASRYQDIYPRQDTIAKYAGISLKWVNRTVASLVSMGLLSKVTRPNKSCLYRASSFFSDFWTRKKLQSLFTSLKWMPIGCLMLPVDILTESSYDINKELFFKKASYTAVNYSTAILSGAHARKSEKRVKKERLVMKSLVIEKVAASLELNEDQIEQLQSYSDNILQLALQKALKSSDIRDKISYFFGICRRELQQRADKKEQSYVKPTGKKYVGASQRTTSDNFGLKNDMNNQTQSPMYSDYKPADSREQLIIDSWNYLSEEEFKRIRDEKLAAISDLSLMNSLAAAFDNAREFAKDRQSNPYEPVETDRQKEHNRFLNKRNSYLGSAYGSPSVVEEIIVEPIKKTSFDRISTPTLEVELMPSLEDNWWKDQPINIDDYDCI